MATWCSSTSARIGMGISATSRAPRFAASHRQSSKKYLQRYTTRCVQASLRCVLAAPITTQDKRLFKLPKTTIWGNVFYHYLSGMESASARTNRHTLAKRCQAHRYTNFSLEWFLLSNL